MSASGGAERQEIRRAKYLGATRREDELLAHLAECIRTGSRAGDQELVRWAMARRAELEVRIGAR